MPLKIPVSRDGHQSQVLSSGAETAFTGGLVLMILALPISEALKNIGYFTALGGWVVKRAARRDFRMTFTPIGVFLSIYFLTSLLSAAFAFDRWEGFRGAWDVFRPLSIFLMMVNEINAVEKIRFYLWLFVASTGIGVVWGLVSYFMGLRPRLEIKSLGHSNHTAWYLVMMLALLISVLLFMDWKPPAKIVVGGITGATLLAVLLTYSRGALVAFVASLLFLAIPLRRWQPILGVALLTLVLVGGLQAWRTPWATHLEMVSAPDQDVSLSDRFSLWKGSVLSLRDRPLLGVGPRNFKYLDHERYGFKQTSHAHSLFFNVIAERGLLGFLSLMALFGCCAYVGMRRWPSKDSLSTALWHAAMGSFITIVVAGVVNTTLHTEGAIAFWSLTALMLVSGEAATPS
ncbi:MAG: O-antigen ligase family protein [Candidatus Methylomirabilis sp.]